MSSIKEANNTMLVGYAILLMVIFFTFLFEKNFTLVHFIENFKVLAKNLFIAAMAPIITLVFNGLLPAHVKAIFVHFRFKNPLPGSRAFSKYMDLDTRIDRQILEQRNGKLPIIGEEENRLWYKIFKKHEDKPNIYQSHKSYLLTRDMAIVTGFFAILCPIAVYYFTSSVSKTGVCAIFYLISYFLLALACNNLSIRFVCNVLAQESM